MRWLLCRIAAMFVFVLSVIIEYLPQFIAAILAAAFLYQSWVSDANNARDCSRRGGVYSAQLCLKPESIIVEYR